MSKWHAFAALAKNFVPLVVATINPKLAPLGDIITDGISEAEALHGASNTEKLEHVQKLVKDTVQGLNVTGKTNIDVDDLDAAVSEVVGKSIQVIKIVHLPVDVTVSNSAPSTSKR